jgi:tetratricopeptide (TPR) repeat protein
MAQATSKEIREPRPPKGAAPPGSGIRRWRTPGICLGLAAITLAVFGQTLHHEFISLDDSYYVYDNPVVARGLTFKGVVWAFTHSYAANWHPLTWLSHMLDCQLYGLRPAGHHLTNVFIHAATAIALFIVLRQMTLFRPAPARQPRLPATSAPHAGPEKDTIADTTWRSAFVAAVFAIHPLRVESVAWAAERKDVLSGLFFMLTIGAYVRYARHPWSPVRYGLVVVLFALGLMCKPMLVTLPLVLLLLDYWPLRRFDLENQKSKIKNLLYEKLPLLALSAASCVITLWAQRTAIHSGGSFLLPYRLSNAVATSMVYLSQMVWPAGLAVFYPFPGNGAPVWELTLAAILLAGLSLFAWKERRTRPWLLVGWLWYLVMLLPVVGVVQAGGQAHADRYTYLPLIGIYAAVTWLVADWHVRPAILCGVATGVLAVLMVCAWKQTGYWRNGETLWIHAIACTKDNDMAHYCLGHDLFLKGKVDEAISQFRQSAEIRTDNADAHNGLGICLYQQGKIDEAISEQEKALATQPHFAAAHNGLGLCLYHRGRVNEAIPQYQMALETDPDYAEAHNNLGNSFFQLGRMDEANAEYQKALRIKPDFAEAHNNLGLCFYHRGRMDEAISQYQKALELNRDYAEAYNNLGNCFFRLRRLDEAISQYQKARELQPNAVTAHMNLGAAFFQLGRVDDAIAEFRKAVEIQPGLAAAHDSLGMGLLQKGKVGEAIDHFRKALEIKPADPKMQTKLAWLLATSAEASVRNGQKAVELAQQATALTGGKDPVSLETLAAAFAEVGRFDDARRNVQKAIELARAAAQQDFAQQLDGELKRYEANHPLHP